MSMMMMTLMIRIREMGEKMNDEVADRRGLRFLQTGDITVNRS